MLNTRGGIEKKGQKKMEGRKDIEKRRSCTHKTTQTSYKEILELVRKKEEA